MIAPRPAKKGPHLRAAEQRELTTVHGESGINSLNSIQQGPYRQDLQAQVSKAPTTAGHRSGWKVAGGCENVQRSHVNNSGSALLLLPQPFDFYKLIIPGDGEHKNSPHR